MLMQNKLWFTASELADLQLSGLPRQKRDINRLARAETLAIAVDGHGVPQARTHVGPCGGLESHVHLLPASARADLERPGLLGCHAYPGAAAAHGGDAYHLWPYVFAACQPALREKRG